MNRYSLVHNGGDGYADETFHIIDKLDARGLRHNVILVVDAEDILVDEDENHDLNVDTLTIMKHVTRLFNEEFNAYNLAIHDYIL